MKFYIYTNEKFYIKMRTNRTSIHSYKSIIAGKVLPWPAGSTYMYKRSFFTDSLICIDWKPLLFSPEESQRGVKKGTLECN